MTVAPEATPARQVSPCRAGRPAPPCNPATLGAVCAGDCGRRMHTRGRNASKRACADGHPTHDGHGRCGGCIQAARRADRRDQESGPVDLGWQDGAACRGADPALFFPHIPAGAQFQPAVEHIAWRYCHACPVRAACGELAARTRSLGLWAGVWRRYRGSSYVATPVIPATRREAS